MKLYDVRRSGNILTISYVGEEGTTEKTYILAYRHYILMYSDLYQYMSSKHVDSGEFAITALLKNEDYDYYFPDQSIGYHKKAVLLFVGDEMTVVEKKLRPFLAKKKKVRKTLKVIDFEISGQQMKLYLGEKNIKDYWGDDWDDRPYEHNAGSVYDEFVTDTVVVNFPPEKEVVESCEGTINSPWCKDDFKNHVAPFAYIMEEGKEPPDYSFHHMRTRSINNADVEKFYFEMPIGYFYDKGYNITEV